MDIKKGDQVIILAGKDKGKTGKVEQALPKKGKVVVTGVNVKKKHMKPNQLNRQGGIKEFSSPIEVSNVKLICPKCSKPTRIGHDMEGKKKERKCKRCKQII